MTNPLTNPPLRSHEQRALSLLTSLALVVLGSCGGSNNGPDGISVVLSAVDKQGERIKITGQIVFELYTYRPASADPKGRQLQTWQLGLAGDRDQRTYWNHTTRMYEFPLQVKLDGAPGASKFVLLARYNNPWNEHLQDQAILDLSSMVSELKERLRGSVTP